MRFALVALMMFSVTGCYSTRDYPAGWDPLLLAQNDCPNIAGEYLSHPIDYEPIFTKVKQADGATRKVYNPRHSWTSRSLFLWKAFGVLPGEHLSITQPDDQTILVHSRKLFGERVGPAPKKRTLSRFSGDFSCDNGRVKINNPLEFSGGGAMGLVAAFGVENKSIFLAPAKDYLIVESMETSGGIALVLIAPIPIYGGENDWFRYARVSESETQFKDAL